MVRHRGLKCGNRAAFRKNWPYYLFIAPSLALLILFFDLPAFSALYHSFFEWDGHTKVFVGLEHFQYMLEDPVLLDSFKNLAVFIVLLLAISLVVPLTVAEMIFNLRSSKRRRFYQVAFLVPGLVPGIVVMLVWQFIYDPYFGPLNALLEKMGFNKMDFLWLANPRTALFCLIFIGFPWVSGTSVLIFMAGLNTIPTSVLDYCRLDGVGAFRRFFHIDIHFVFGQVRLLLITGFIGLMQGFGLQLILTNGGPGTSTMVPGHHMYLNAFTYDRLGYASALGLVLALIILTFTVVNLKYLRIRS